MSNYNRPIIPYGNSFYINIELKQFNKDSGEYEYFDITTCHDVKVNLICAQHNTVIPLQFELLEGFNYILKCFVDYRLLHTTSYGVMVEGLNADDMHWRWTMLPKEGLLVVNNTSGMNIPDDVTTVDLAGRVGWGIQTDADLTNYYTKTEVNTLLENVEVDLDDYYTKSEVDGKLDDKQETLESGVNIKTVNGESILGSGNIEIQGGGDEQVQSDWNETDTTSPAYIQNKPDIQSIEGSIADVQNDIDNLEDDIAAQQAEISGVQTAISGHQTALESQATEISGIQTQISGHQTALENNASEINGIQSAISGHQTAIENLDTDKQDVLESGVNIKTINNESILGEGNITIESGVDVEPAKIVVTDEEVAYPDPDAVYIVQKPINLKTINGEEIVGEGNIEIEADTSEIEEQLTGIQTVVAGHQSAIESQATEISGIQTVVSGHQTALESQATEISGMQSNISGMQTEISGVQTAISGHQTAIQNQATEISGMQSNISGIQTEISGIQTTIAGHQTAIQNQATEISGMQTVLAGHQTALENQSGGGDPGFIKVTNGNKVGLVSSLATNYNSNIGDYAVIEGNGFGSNQNTASGDYSHAEGMGCKALGYTAHAEGYMTTALDQGHAEGYMATAEGQASHAEGRFTNAQRAASHVEGEYTQAINIYEHASGRYNESNGGWTSSYPDSRNTLFSVGNGTSNSARHNAFEIRQNGDIYLNDGTHPISSTTNGLKIEVVSALPATPDANTIYIVQ